MDCSRSSLLEYEFPPPTWYPGHGTGSTISAWARPWTILHYWTPPEIAATFRQYWDDTVTANDKTQPVTCRAGVDWAISTISLQAPATVEADVCRIFDLGISAAHHIALSSQQPPTDPHSIIQGYQNVVFGEPDYLLRNPTSHRVTGICEAKSPWNIGPSEIDDVISGSNKIDYLANKR